MKELKLREQNGIGQLNYVEAYIELKQRLMDQEIWSQPVDILVPFVLFRVMVQSMGITITELTIDEFLARAKTIDKANLEDGHITITTKNLRDHILPFLKKLESEQEFVPMLLGDDKLYSKKRESLECAAEVLYKFGIDLTIHPASGYMDNVVVSWKI